MTILNRPLLLFLIALAVPIILHLFNRRSAKRIEWGAMQFLMGSLVSRRRRILLEEVLLLGCRCLLVALAVLAVARPFVPAGSRVPWLIVLPAVLFGVVALAVGTAMWQQPKNRWTFYGIGAGLLAIAATAMLAEEYLQLGRLIGDQRDVVLVIDGSGSMTAEIDGKSNFERAIHEAKQMVRKMGKDAAVHIVLAGASSQFVNPTSPTDATRLEAKLDELKPTGGALDIHAAIRAAGESLDKGHHAAKQVVVLTDGQRTGWLTDDEARWQDTIDQLDVNADEPRLFCRTYAPPDGFRNLAVTGVSIDRSVLGIGRPAKISVRVENTGDQPVAATALQLKIANAPASQQRVESLEPGEAEAIEFDGTFVTPGTVVCTARLLIDDDLADDNTVAHVAYVVDRLPVLLVNGGPARRLLDQASGFIQLALDPDSVREAGDELPESDQTSLISVTAIDAQQLGTIDDLSRYRAVILADVPRLPQKQAERLSQYVRSGGGLLVAPGERAQTGFYNEWMESEEEDSAAVMPARLGDWVTRKADEKLARPQPNSLTHPALEPLVAHADSDLFELGIARYRQLDLDDAARGVVVGGQFDNGDALLVQKRVGQGSVLQTAISLDNVSGNLVTLEAFPELLHRVVYHLSRAGDVELNFAGGEAISIALPNIAPAGRMATATEPGLVGEYFNSADFDDRKFARRDANLDFGWGWQPGGGVDPNNFSVRWNGYVMPRFDETYTFLLESSGDAKLWIDGKQALAEPGEARVRMRALRRHPIRVEFADRGGVRFLRLQWSSASQRREAVPASLLSHATEAAEVESATNVVAIETPNGQPLEASARQRGAALVISVEGAISPGLYQVRPPQSLRAEMTPYLNPDGELLFTVSADPRESDMTPLTEEDYDQLVELAGMQRVAGFDDLMAIAANRPRGRELWKYLAVCALILLVCEVAITRWIAAQRGSDVELTVSFRPGGRTSPVELEEFAR
jgi:hypothetical protein